MRLYVRMRTVLAGTEALCIGSVRPVGGPVEKSAGYGVYVGPALSATDLQQKSAVCLAARRMCLIVIPSR